MIKLILRIIFSLIFFFFYFLIMNYINPILFFISTPIPSRIVSRLLTTPVRKLKRDTNSLWSDSGTYRKEFTGNLPGQISYKRFR